jgi:DNA-binding transcriptional LysR family regulator
VGCGDRQDASHVQGGSPHHRDDQPFGPDVKPGGPVQAVKAHRSAEHGRLRVGASTTPGFYLLPGLFGRFHARYPRVDLHYAVENSLRIEQMIVRNELDLGFVGAHLAHDDLDLERLVDDEIVCFAGSSHPLAGRRRIAPRSLKKHT